MSTSDDLNRLSEALISRRCGVVTSVTQQPRGPDEPCPPHIWNATLAHFGAQQFPLSMRFASGKGRSEEEAKLSALGEAIERYGAFQWDHQRVRSGPMHGPTITPDDCVLYSAPQYAMGAPYQKWEPGLEVSWITGIELPEETPVALPASMVYLAGPQRAQDFFTPVSSNGLAAGPDLTGAVLGGCYEVIERDALMLTWLNRLPATQIETPAGGCNAAAIIRHYEKFGVTVRLLLLQSDQAPYVIMAIAEDASQGGIFRVVGLGCDCDPVVALDKAVFELVQLRSGMKTRMQDQTYPARLARYDGVRTLDDHALFHVMPEHAGEFGFLTQIKKTCDIHALANRSGDTSAATLKIVTEAAIKSGARVAYADITPADIRPLGPRVVRVFVTGLQPIDFGYGHVRLGGTRLFRAPVDWGIRPRPLTPQELNPCPHPLA
ncbi:YcaO-like family protein [Yoonia sp. BS5-3]|uniref:YcaO-like family protein n=1 Tax=Yoonia phaeophyticola TaxID=3137369 RepID=A0ABZ2V7Q1_9RHOB